MATGQGGAGAPEPRGGARARQADAATASGASAAPSAPAQAAAPVTPVTASATDGPTAPEAGESRWRGWFRDPATGRPVWWVEILILVALYYCYTATRGFADGDVAKATRTGETLVRWQNTLHLNMELSLNHWLQTVPPLAVACCYYYATLHFIVTPGVILWMHRRHGPNYSRARWTLVFTTLLCLLGFYLFPTAPPRLLPDAGYIDTMAKYSGYGWWSANASAAPHGLGKVANLYAAMPSLHCAWAMWCGVLIALHARRQWVRVLGVLYPCATAFVVMATGNHYILDAIAGWTVLGVSALTATALTRRSGRRRPARPATGDAAPAVLEPPRQPGDVTATPDPLAAAVPADDQPPANPGGKPRPAAGGLATL